MEDILDRVKELAKKNNLSIHQVEEKANIGKNSIYSWRRSQPKIESVSKVADILKTNTDYLVGRSNDPSPIDQKEDPAMYFRIDMKNVPEDKRDEFKNELSFLKDYMLKKLQDMKKEDKD